MMIPEDLPMVGPPSDASRIAARFFMHTRIACPGPCPFTGPIDARDGAGAVSVFRASPES